ncbi:Acyl-CoA thioesterase [Geodermatophilus telluris]|uniref:Acyl-CoA thioesterase n=1 Tax=Geodermatophilus telluris TaxID=1190417 RepID=A0A1G6LVX3_9ACTN|nr:thioesterase family protein [Geodermatophilus telluris]SDC46856.1 Acyl-CoA thioesterase [Geodermatophilus telluris]
MPQTETGPSAFDRATAVTRTEGGGLRARLDPGWDVGNGVLNGGYLLAVVARAALADSPHPHPVALSASYLRATPGGPADLAVTPGPAGRTLAHSTVLLSGAAGPSLSVQVTTATLGAGPTEHSVNPAPELPAPDGCVATRTAEGGPAVGLARQLDTRLDPATAGWVVGRPSDQRVLRAWIRLADGRAPDPLALLLFADALPPTAFAVGKPGWAPTVQLQVLVRALPAPGWCLLESRSTEVTGGWSDEECRIWDATGRLVAQARQLARVAR